MSNCRDLGGYPTKDGKVTNFGVFIRSEAPVRLTPEDIQLLKNYNITKSIDFRGDNDIIDFPSQLNRPDFEYIRLPMFGRADALGFEDKVDDPSKNFTGWEKNYIQWCETYKGWVRDVIHQLAITKGACQYNCNAGKDRTGIISAFLLSIAGVCDNDIAYDYCLSRTLLKPRFQELSPQWGAYLKDDNGELLPNHPFLFTPKKAMIIFMNYIHNTYTSAENYLLSCGVTKNDITKIKNKLTK